MNKKFALEGARKLIINNQGMQIAIWVPLDSDTKINKEEVDWIDGVDYNETNKTISFPNGGKIFILSSENWTQSRGMNAHCTFFHYSHLETTPNEAIQCAQLMTRLGDDPHIRLM